MATDLTVILPDRPGTLADMGEALGSAGVNIYGMCGFPCEGKGVIHVLVDDGEVGAALGGLQSVGLEVSGQRPVLVLDIEDRPGTFGAMARRIADAGVNVNLAYLATGTRLVLGADDLDKAQAAL